MGSLHPSWHLRRFLPVPFCHNCSCLEPAHKERQSSITYNFWQWLLHSFIHAKIWGVFLLNSLVKACCCVSNRIVLQCYLKLGLYSSNNQITHNPWTHAPIGQLEGKYTMLSLNLTIHLVARYLATAVTVLALTLQPIHSSETAQAASKTKYFCHSVTILLLNVLFSG